jgi:hypothetical protein
MNFPKKSTQQREFEAQVQQEQQTYRSLTEAENAVDDFIPMDNHTFSAHLKRKMTQHPAIFMGNLFSFCGI